MFETLRVDVGRPVRIELDAASGTGYGWVVTSATRGLEAVVGTPTPTRPGMPGAPETTGLTIVAAEPGEYELRAELRRPWEETAAEERRFAISAR